MKNFTIYYREKGNPCGKPVARLSVKASSFDDALRQRNHPELTWHSILNKVTGEVVTLAQVRAGEVEI